MKTASYRASSVLYRTDKESQHGVAEVTMYGPATFDAHAFFRPLVLGWVRDDPAVLFRLDKACDTLSMPPSACKAAYPDNSPPMAVVLNPSQNYELWEAHSRRLARLGIVRAVFLASEIDDAIEFVRDAARLARRRSASPRETAESGFGSL